MENSSYLAYNSSGLSLYDGGNQAFGKLSQTFEPFEASVKFIITSKDGKRIAWISNGEVSVVEAPSWNKIGTLKHPKAQELCFSPQGTYIAVFDTFARKIGDAPIPNLSIYNVEERKLIKAYLHQTQFNWQPQWTGDESIVARQQTSEVMFYAADNLEQHTAKKVLAKVRSYSLSQSRVNHYVAFFVPCVSEAPAYIHLYKYPEFKDASKALANKSFYKVDTVEFFWNPQSFAVLILTTAPPDKTGTSYYGDQMLFYLNVRGDSTRVTFDKNGNIRSVCWCPSGKEFIAVYGSAPSRATVFNAKCDAVKNFGDGARNVVMVNPPGNIVLIGAMGNISSRFEFWNLAETKLISQLECSDITHMEWSPCGKYILTSTCSPRLRVNNGYRIFHYSSTLIHEFKAPQGMEVFQMLWLCNKNLSKPFAIENKAVKGIEYAVKTSSAKRYIPPSQRAAQENGGMVDEVKRFLSERDQPSSTYIDPKAAEKKEKRKQANLLRQQKKEKEDDDRGDWRKPKTEEEMKKEQERKDKKDMKEKKPPVSEEEQAERTKANRRKNLRKKLDSINQLKKEREEGKTLLKGQEDKIKLEAKLIQEMEQLSAS